MQNEVRLKIGEIEFEAKGDADVIERERNEFFKVLPLAVEAMMRTRSEKIVQEAISTEEYQQLPISISAATNETAAANTDLSRTSLAEFIAQKGAESHNDFILCAAYFNEMKNNIKDFSSKTVETFYSNARKTKPSNISDSLNKMCQKGLIIDSPDAPNATPKMYRLSVSGIKCVDAMQPKEGKERKSSTNGRKPRTKTESVYSEISIDELNLKNYPTIKTLKGFKEKMIMVLYILANEKKGDWFSTADVMFILTSKFGEPATKNQVDGIFNNNKIWFDTKKADGGNKGIVRKLLNGGLDFAKEVISAQATDD